MRFALAPLLLIGLPVIEIAGFIIVGREIGVLATIGLIFLMAILGAVLLRIQGLGLLARINAETRAGRVPGRELVHGVMLLVAGLLLIIPGFVTDILGLLLFIPAVRDLGWRFLKTRITIVASGMEGRREGAGWSPRSSRGPGGTGGATIDLDEEDFRRDPSPGSPWREGDGGKDDRRLP